MFFEVGCSDCSPAWKLSRRSQRRGGRVPRLREAGQPSWPAILNGVIEKTYRNLHKAEPARVLSYDSEKQTVNVQPVVDFEVAPGEYARSVPLRDVPVCWP